MVRMNPFAIAGRFTSARVPTVVHCNWSAWPLEGGPEALCRLVSGPAASVRAGQRPFLSVLEDQQPSESFDSWPAASQLAQGELMVAQMPIAWPVASAV